MDKTQHTPGPWKVDGGKGKHGDLYIWPDDNLWGGHAVATVHQEIQEGADANARLIAAAPALLFALEDILAALKKARTVRAPAGHYDEDIYYNGIDFAPQMDIAAEIIRQAKGE